MTSRRGSRRASGTTSIASPTAAPTSRSTSATSGALPRHLDTDAMHQAAQRLIGKHDFTTFRDTECQAKSPEKTLDQLDVIRNGDDVNIITSARSFLHSQVRSMVGSLVWVGDGRWSADDLSAALAARNRAACGPVAPPDGLIWCRCGSYIQRRRSSRQRPDDAVIHGTGDPIAALSTDVSAHSLIGNRAIAPCLR